MTHQLLPKEEWTKPDEVSTTMSVEGGGHAANVTQDVPYLSNIVTELEAEMAEREDLEAMIITKRNKNANAANSNH
jgi:ubiquinol-cytochrome c reductase subunit 7